MRVFLRNTALFLVMLLAIGITAYLIPLSPRWTAKLLSNEVEYVFMDEEAWLQKHSLPRLLWVKLIEFKSRRDIKQHLANRLGLASKQPADRIYATTQEIRKLYITQLQETVPIISNSTLASFVRGFGYCDHINGFLAYTLTGYLDKVQLYGLKDETGQSPHALIRSESELGVVWIDAFTCVDAFGFETDLSPLGKKYIPTYQEIAPQLHPPTYYQQAVFTNDYSFDHNRKKALTRLMPLLQPVTETSTSGPAPQKTTGIAMAQNQGQQKQWLDAIMQEPEENKQQYLEARVLQLFDQKKEAAAIYQQLIARAPESLLAAYSRHFLKRIAQQEPLCGGELHSR